MRNLLLLLVLALSVPSVASALTVLDPGGSAVNPIYVQDVTPPQLQKPAEVPSYPRPKLQELQPTVTPTAPVFVPAPRPTVIYVNNPIATPIAQPVVPVGPSGGSNAGVESCDKMVAGQLTHLGFLSPADCYAQWQAAVEAKQKEYVVPSKPTLKKVATEQVAAVAVAVTQPTTTPTIANKVPEHNWWQKFLMWLGGL